VKEALDRQIARLRMRLAKTPLPRFFAWWGGELLACLPEKWRKKLAGRSEALLLDVREREAVVWRERNQSAVEYGRIDLTLPADAQLEEFRRLRTRVENPAVRTILCVPGSRALLRSMTLPAAAEDNLRQVLSFEMDRQTPFKADQVYFDSRIVSRDEAARNMRVEMVVLPRNQLDPQIAAIGGGSLELDGVDIWNEADSQSGRQRINLLPIERRARRRNMRLPLNLGLAALAIVLLAINMSESLSNRAIAVETMQAEVDKAGAAAREVLELKKTLQDSISGANFLADKKRTGPTVIGLIADVTHRLNDDTYLERLSVENNQVQLQGQSKEAATLITVLSASPYLANPRLEGQIQPDPRTGKDRFTISAEPKQVSIEETALPVQKPEVSEAAVPETNADSKTEVIDGKP
jgi:general secretion pathway protein L